ncbi:hypothetical protein R3P38DRAFT_2649398 [Favolaschia claudopus]|uniref:F-box domain-containing protein n=1 Tax=Favolaschia claudopus TaxID=2862362 RepID=A0AAW0A5M8_9AGAR
MEESPFADRFGTNYVPTDDEIDQIKSDLLSRTAELARIDERIRELSEQRDKILAYIEPRKALISHPRRLPMDILETIFLECLPSTRNAVMSAQEAPLLVCRICSAWRTAALSMPRLWASLHIHTDFIVAKSETRTAAVEQWLNRAAASSLSLSVCVGGIWGWGAPPDSDRKTEALVAVLARSSSQWQNIMFADMTRETAQALAEIEPPHLRSFRITGDLSNLSHLSSNFLNGQHLRSVSLCSDSDLNLVPNLPIGWQQLTHLVVQSAQITSNDFSITISNMIPLLGRCPQLVSLHVALSTERPPAGRVSPVALPFLESFTLPIRGVVWSQSHLRYIADCVSMPKLRRFHLPIENVESELDEFSLASVAARYPLVQDLAIHLDSFHTQALLETFRAFTALTRLVVDARAPSDPAGWGDWDSLDSCGTVPFLELLTDQDVCPRLQELEIFDILKLSKHILNAFLSARVHSTCRLKRLSLAFEEFRSNSMIPRLSPSETRFYASQGLHISISSLAQSDASYTPSPWTGLPPEYFGLSE